MTDVPRRGAPFSGRDLRRSVGSGRTALARSRPGLALLGALIAGTSCDTLPTSEFAEGAIEISAPGGAAGLNLMVGDTVQLTTRGTAGTVRWSSDDEVVARVLLTGAVVANRPGRATITARNEGRSGSIEVTVINQPPMANAGGDLTVAVGIQVTLDGGGSTDADGEITSYAWSFVSRPAGSTAQLSSTNTSMTTFTPDAAGDYVVNLTVNDGFDSDDDQVTVTAITPVVQCQLAPPNLDFGKVFTTGESADLVFRLTNTGNAGTQGNISESCAAFQIPIGGGSFSFPPGGVRDVTVRFMPDDNSPGLQSCSILTGVPECPSLSSTGIGGVRVSQLLSRLTCTSGCHTNPTPQLPPPNPKICCPPPPPSYNWLLQVTSTANPPTSQLLVYPQSGAHTGGDPGPDWDAPNGKFYKQLIAWIAQGRLNQ